MNDLLRGVEPRLELLSKALPDMICCVDYILDNEKEDYLKWCEENEYDPYFCNHTSHIYGVARDALALGPMEKP